jgi:hypothetical protein
MEHVAHMGKNSYRGFVGKTGGNRPLGKHIRVDGKIILNPILKI